MKKIRLFSVKEHKGIEGEEAELYCNLYLVLNKNYILPPALNAVFPLPLGGHCHAPAPGEAESAGVLSCVCPEASPWGSSPAPGSELSSAAGVGHGVGEGEPSEPS